MPHVMNGDSVTAAVLATIATVGAASARAI